MVQAPKAQLYYLPFLSSSDTVGERFGPSAAAINCMERVNYLVSTFQQQQVSQRKAV